MDDMERVVVSQSMMPADWGLYALVYMQVCAVDDATDEEILQVCNYENLCGTSQGWCTVIRSTDDDEKANMLPVACEDFPGRQHVLVSC